MRRDSFDCPKRTKKSTIKTNPVDLNIRRDCLLERKLCRGMSRRCRLQNEASPLRIRARSKSARATMTLDGRTACYFDRNPNLNHPNQWSKSRPPRCILLSNVCEDVRVLQVAKLSTAPLARGEFGCTALFRSRIVHDGRSRSAHTNLRGLVGEITPRTRRYRVHHDQWMDGLRTLRHLATLIEQSLKIQHLNSFRHNTCSVWGGST